MAITILSIGILVFAGHFLTGLFERTKIPDVLVLMLAGIVIGPVLNVVTIDDFGKVGPVFTTLALIVILFEGGIHLSIRQLGSAAKDTLIISLATFVVTVLIIMHLADLFLPVEPLTALLIGTILGGTSSAVVVPLLRVLRPGNLPQTVLLLESALTDVLAVVLSLGLMRALTPGAAAVTAGSIAGDVARSFFIAALLGLAGAFVWSAILPKVRQFPNTVFTTIAYVLILFGVAEQLGYNGAIAALTFGIAVANLPSIPERVLGKIFSFRLVGFAEVERTFFAEAVFLVKTFFFVYLGISIGFARWQTVLVGLVMALVAFGGRAAMVRLLAPRTFTRRDALLTTALIPKGLAAAVLAALPSQMGIPNGDLIQDTAYAVVFLSIVLCAAAVFVVESGRVSGLAAGFFGPFPTALPEPDEGPAPVPAFDQSIGLPALDTAVLQEPNPVSLDVPEPRPAGPPPPDGPAGDPPPGA